MTGFKLRDKRLLKLEIVLGLAWARFLIRHVPFRWWRGTLGPIDGRNDVALPQLTAVQEKKASDIGRIVRRLADHMPFKAVCLPQAMCARWMLARRGIPTRMVIGSRRDTLEASLLFHAWLLAGDSTVTGGDESERFSAMGRQQAASE